jgi:hypothetical protein
MGLKIKKKIYAHPNLFVSQQIEGSENQARM